MRVLFNWIIYKQMQNILSFGESIRQFRSESGRPVFEQAQGYPTFFEKHLLHPARRIKALLNDPNANIRAFYLQYLMLCFEIENQNYEFYITKIQKFLLDPNFTFLFLEEDDDKIFNDKQFKRFVLQFMEILDSGEFQSTQAALNAYPIADIVFVYFFRSLTIYANITNDYDSYIDKTTLFGFLLQNFSIDAQMYEQKCIKFIEAEVFVYQQSPQQIYIVYKDTQNTLTSSKNSKISQSLNNNSLTSKSDNQQVQQNISMLEQQEQNVIETNSNNEAFRKKLLENQNNNVIKFQNQLEQQPSILSRNDDQIDSQIQLEQSFKKSLIELSGLNQKMPEYQLNTPIPQLKKQDKKIENSKSSSISHEQMYSSSSQILNTKQQKQKQVIENKIQKSVSYGQKSQQSSHRDLKEKETIPQTTITNDNNHYTITINQQPMFKQYYAQNHSPNMQKYNSQIYGAEDKKYSTNNFKFDYNNQYGIANRERSSISQTDPYQIYKSPSSPLDTSPRKQISSTSDILAKITQINSRFNSSIKNNSDKLDYNTVPSTSHSYGHNQYKASSVTHPIKQAYKIQSNNYLNNCNQFVSITHIPPTRDIPLQPYSHSSIKNSIYSDAKSNPYTGLTPLKQYPRQSHLYDNYSQSYRNNQIPHISNKEFKNTTEYQSYIYSTTDYQSPKIKQPYNKTTDASSLAKFSKETFSPFSNGPTPKQTYKNQTSFRDLRQESITNKDKLRQVIMGKLSVSKEFTDSLTLMKMGEPYNNNIKKMKKRSREFRQSIINCLK